MRMKESKLKLSSTCELVKTVYSTPSFAPEVSLDYVERSPDSYYSDTETSVDLDKEKAREIIAFLQEAFGI
jgi:hypothetical protein